jgi:chromosomal replication initiation ATPase DnaA
MIEPQYKIMYLTKPRAHVHDPAISKKVEKLITRVLRVNNLLRHKMLERCREKPYPDSIKVISFLMQTRLGLTYSQMGAILNRDHSSIVYNVKWIKEHKKWIKDGYYPEIKEMLKEGRKALR